MAVCIRFRSSDVCPSGSVQCVRVRVRTWAQESVLEWAPIPFSCFLFFLFAGAISRTLKGLNRYFILPGNVYLHNAEPDEFIKTHGFGGTGEVRFEFVTGYWRSPRNEHWLMAGIGSETQYVISH